MWTFALPLARQLHHSVRGWPIAWFAGVLLGATGAGASAAGSPTPRLPPSAAGIAQVQQVAVFGEDDRQLLPGSLAFLDASIGLFYSDKARSSCTGFCVGERTVATAAHCLFRTAGERPPALASFRFRVGNKQRQESAIAGHEDGAVYQSVLAGSHGVQVKPPIDATRDWALVRLARPVCRGAELSVEAATPAQLQRLGASGHLLQVGFHDDFGAWQLAAARSCEVVADLPTSIQAQLQKDFSDAKSLLLHRCDTGQASSGSPILSDHEGRIRVVALNVGTYLRTRLQVAGNAVRHRYRASAIANTAVSGSAFAGIIGPFTRARLLSGRDEVRSLQAALTRLGLDPGPVDGFYGDKTRAAVELYHDNVDSRLPALPTLDLLRQMQRRAERLK